MAWIKNSKIAQLLRELGPVLPVLRVHGEVVDGREVEKQCRILGLTPRFLDLTPEQAATLLYTCHPERALDILWRYRAQPSYVALETVGARHPDKGKRRLGVALETRRQVQTRLATGKRARSEGNPEAGG